MGRRINLPVLGAPSAIFAFEPTLQAMRTRLGGPYVPSLDIETGAAVLVGGKLGIVLGATATSSDIWIGNGVVRRTASTKLLAYDGALPDDLSVVATDVKQFAQLQEGTKVAYSHPTGEQAVGLLLEKCRFGGLVANDDGSIVALGFRRLRAVVGEDWN